MRVSRTVSGERSHAVFLSLNAIFGSSEVFDADNGITIIHSALIIKLEVYGAESHAIEKDYQVIEWVFLKMVITVFLVQLKLLEVYR